MADPRRQEWRCPVCGELTWTDVHGFNWDALTESTDWCDCGCYRGYSGLGNHEEQIGPHEWQWSWRDDEDHARYRRRRGERDAALAEGRLIPREFLRALAAAPADAAPRGVLADWCDEHGLPGWAAFFRAEAARLAAAGRPGG